MEMKTSSSRRMLPACAAAFVLAAACHSGSSSGVASAPAPAPDAAQLRPGTEAYYMARAREDSIRHPYTQADVDFMTGMIHHHAQALIMARWAPTHGANPSVQTLCERIINGQTDEIHLMQNWLRDRGKPVPDPDHPDTMGMPMSGMGHDMPGMGQEMLMPGMLTGEQMKALDAARGADFDRLFLQGMIQHHTGALTMVKDLFAHEGAGQDELVFKFASDVNVDQTTEIHRMQRMLAAVTLGINVP
jgi:uncharacterized protein (DUF305 family)